jgi:deoxyribose-phosphate aldolase
MENEQNFQIELLCLDKSADLDKLMRFAFASSTRVIDKLCIQILPDIRDSIVIASQIDFPDGLSSSISRSHDAMYSVRYGAKYVDLVINNVLLEDGQWGRIAQEVGSMQKMCAENNVVLRAVIEYSLHTSDILINLCEILLNNGVDTIINSTGRVVDNVTDNLLSCQSLKGATGINIVACGRLYTEKQLNLFKSIGIERFRMSFLPSVEKIVGKLV